MLTLDNDTLSFKFPQVHEDARTDISLQITLRIPDDATEYPLPPGLGRFPLRHTEDFQGRVPAEWAVRGGVMLPMHKAEAMWIAFRRDPQAYPCAIKIAAGKINAVSGKPWRPELDADDIDYIVVPHQPWLDGFAVGEGQVRQFVAMPLGGGYTAEEQITGKAEWGGLQIIVYPMKRERWEAMEAARIERERAAEERRRKEEERRQRFHEEARAKAAASGKLRRGLLGAAHVAPAAPIQQSFSHGRSRTVEVVKGRSSAFATTPDRAALRARAEAPVAMGLGAGGRMSQEIFRDPYGIDAWDQAVSARCFLTMVDVADWQRLTGEEVRRQPPTAYDYAKAGLPWFEYAADGQEALPGAMALTMLKTVDEVAQGKGLDPLPGNETVVPAPLIKLGP